MIMISIRCSSGTLAALIAGVFASSVLQAQDAPTSLAPMTVIGARGAAPAAPQTMLSADALQHSAAREVDQVLRQLPSFSLFRRSSSQVAHPTSQGVTLRGIAPSGVSRSLVLLDGVPLNDPFGGWVYWSRVPRAALGWVNVQPGGLSSAWGSAALSGVIQLNTLEQAGLLVDAGGGSDGRQQVEYQGRFSHATQTVSLRGAWRDSDGYPLLRADQRGLIDQPARSQQRLARVGLESRSGDLSWRVGAEAFSEERSNGTPLTGNDTRLKQLDGQLKWSAGSSDWQWLFYYQDQEFSSRFSAQADDRASELPALDQFLVPARALGTTVQWSRRSRWYSSHAGLDLRLLRGETNERFFFRDGAFSRQRQAGASQTQLGAFGEHAGAKGPLSYALAVRIDHFGVDDAGRFEKDLESGETRRAETFADREHTKLSPRIDLRYAATIDTTLRFAAYRAYRAPTINELVRPFRVRSDITAANEALDAETLSGVELGVDRHGLGWQTRLNLYWNRLDDAIANVTIGPGPGSVEPCGFVPAGGSCRQRQNLGYTTARGVELEAERELGPGLRLAGALHYAKNEVRDGPAAISGKRVAQAPRVGATVQLRYSGLNEARLALRYQGDQFEDDLNQRLLASFVVWDLHLARNLKHGWGIYLSVENLLDKEFAVSESGEGLVGIGAPRQVFAGVRWRSE